MKVALVSGDGLPISGLLTVFRNVVDLLGERSGLRLPIPADLGYSWRPDKPAFFPRGSESTCYPDWLTVIDAVPVDRPDFAHEIGSIRRDVARAELLSAAERRDLHQRIETLSRPYEHHFSRWLAEHDVDWVYAINMTLSDAVPVTLGLHRAVARRWDGTRPGGILFWDHDLFGSYSVHDEGERVYPRAPNEFTVVPGGNPAHRWAVVSQMLGIEASGYPTDLTPRVVPNVLPKIPSGGLAEYHREFLRQFFIAPGRPVLLAPVRVFRVKGLEISVRLLAEVRLASEQRGEPAPYLLVFGDLREDPGYSAEVLAAVDTAGVGEDIRFLGGVPLGTHRDASGRWRLDEVDLLRISAVTNGGVFFTPNRPDVESVGLGPALAAVAGVPCAVTKFDAFDEVYGADFRCVRVEPTDGLRTAATAFVDWIVAQRARAGWFTEAIAANQARVTSQFTDRPWRDLLGELDALGR